MRSQGFLCCPGYSFALSLRNQQPLFAKELVSPNRQIHPSLYRSSLLAFAPAHHGPIRRGWLVLESLFLQGLPRQIRHDLCHWIFCRRHPGEHLREVLKGSKLPRHCHGHLVSTSVGSGQRRYLQVSHLPPLQTIGAFPMSMGFMLTGYDLTVLPRIPCQAIRMPTRTALGWPNS